MASIGIPIALDLIKKVSGAAAPRMGTAQPPPFYGSWNQNTIGKGKKKIDAPKIDKSSSRTYCYLSQIFPD